MSQTEFYPDWREKVAFSDEGPCPKVLLQTDKVKIVLAGLKAGQKIPPHPETLAVFHILEGKGWVIVDGERLAVSAGATVIAQHGTARGFEAETQLVFLATRVA